MDHLWTSLGENAWEADIPGRLLWLSVGGHSKDLSKASLRCFSKLFRGVRNARPVLSNLRNILCGDMWLLAICIDECTSISWLIDLMTGILLSKTVWNVVLDRLPSLDR